MADMTGTYISSGELQGTIVSAGLIAGTIVGMRGLKGDKGDKGDTGDTGNGIASAVLNADYTLTLTFTDGTSYTTGSIRGSQGQQGEQGPQGIQGETGAKGDKGDKGDTGPQGAQGIQGEKGDTGSQGPQGIQGETGPTGPTGATPALSVGSVTTLPAGSSVTVTITGTTDAPILNFGIPKGDPGQDGGIDVDDAISSTSFNPVQNRVIYNALQGKADTSDIPTKTSDLTNDSGFLTQHQDISGKVDKVTGKGLSTNDYTTTEKNKLAGIAEGAEVNVQSDWNQTTSTADDYIKNKPSIPTKVSDLTNDSGFITTETDPTVPAWAKAATKPSYTYAEISGTPTLAAVATSGSYTDLSNKPTIPTVPTDVSAFNNDAGYLTSHQSIKTINNTSMVGSGNVAVQPTLVSGTNIKTVNSTSLLGSGNIAVQSKISAVTVTISVADWSATTTCTKSVSGVTASNNVVVTPAPASIADWQSAGVYCSAQASGTLTFTCSSTPSASLTVNVLVIK